jgi:hypothetical protein
MAYRLFCGIAASQEEYLARRAHWSAYCYNDLDDALGQARLLEKTPNRSWEIEGDDGTRFNRIELMRIVRERGTELVGRPKVY